MSRFDTMRFEDMPREKQIERWENCERVLKEMTPHERRRHWDMEHFGYKNECGTVCCAAGRCGLDPWFRRRGFRLILEGVTFGYPVLNTSMFFGHVGADRIFYNTKKRPVSQVIKEVRAYIKELKALPVNEV